MTTNVSQNSPNSPAGKPNGLIVALIIAGVLIAGLIVLQRQFSKRSSSDTDQIEKRANSSADRNYDDRTRLDAGNPVDPTLPKILDSSTTTASAAPETGERSESGPVSFYVDDFRAYRTSLTGYELEGLIQTADGIELLPSKDPVTSDSAPRIGVLESPSLTLTMASSAVAPLWRVKPGENSSINVEIALSPDQEKWTDWFPIQPSDDQIAEFFPDGRPNPSFGSVSGSLISNGLDLFPFARYRVTVISGSDQSPILQEFRLFHTDTTEGQGQPGVIPDPTPVPDPSAVATEPTPATDFSTMESTTEAPPPPSDTAPTVTDIIPAAPDQTPAIADQSTSAPVGTPPPPPTPVINPTEVSTTQTETANRSADEATSPSDVSTSPTEG